MINYQDKSKDELIADLIAANQALDAFHESYKKELAAREQIEFKLKESESLYSSILAASPDVITITDLGGKIVFTSSRAMEMFGYDNCEGFLGHNMIEYIDPAYHEKAISGLTSMFNGKMLGAEEYLAVKSDGSNFYVEVNGEFIRDASGQLYQMIFTTRDITGRKKSEASLLESEKRLRNLVNSQTNYVIRTDLNGNHTYLNKKTEEDFGWAMKDKNVADGDSMLSICEYHHQRTRETVQKCLSSPGEIFQVELDKPMQDGSIKTTLWEFVCLTDSNNNPSEIQCMGIDITEKKAAELEIRKSEEKYRSLINSSDSAIMMIDANGYHLFFNAIAAAPFGKSPDELVGLRVHDLYPPDQIDVFLAEISTVINTNTGKIVVNEIDLAGEKRWYRTSLQPVRDEAGKPYAVLMYATNITETKSSEEQLRKLSSAVVQSPVSIVITNLEGNIEYANPKTCETTGYTLEELIGQNPRVLKSGETNSRDYEHLWGSISGGAEWKGIFHNKKKNGELYWESSTISPIFDADGKITHYLAIKEDITEHRRIQVELQESQERLSQIADISQTLIWEVNAEGLFTYVSPVVGKILGVIPEQIVQKVHFLNLIQEGYREKVNELFKSQQAIKQFICPVNTADQRILWIEVNGAPCYDENNNFYGYRGGTNDITTRKLAEDELLKFRTISDQANYGNAISDLNGVLIYANDVFARMHGYEVTELEGRHLSMLHSEQQMVHVNETLQLVQKEGGFTAKEIWRTRKDGSVFPTLMNAKLILDKNKIPLFMSATAIDITEKKLRDNEIKKLSLAVSQSPVSIVITDLDANIEYVNPAFITSSGYHPEEVIGKNPNILKSGNTDIKVYQHLWNTIISGKTWQGEWINKKKNGDFYWESVSITPIFDESGRITNYLAVKQDITQRKQAESEIRDLNANLELKIAERTLQLSATNENLLNEIEERKQVEETLKIKTGELENFFNVSLDLLSITDLQGNFLKLSRAWESTLGYTIAELEQHSFFDFVHPDDIRETLDVMQNTGNKNPIINFINRYKTKQGDFRFIEWRSAPVGDLLYSAARDITERKRAYEFELELLQMSTKLTGIGVSEIDQSLNLALSKIGQFLEVDRSYIFEFDFDGKTMSNTYEWCNEGISVEIDNLQKIPLEAFPLWIEDIENKQNIVIQSVDDLPDSSEVLRKELQQQGIKSLVVIPLLLNDKPTGFMGLDAVTEKREFKESEINTLKVWGAMIAGLINKQHNEKLLEQTRQNYETFFNTIDDFLWVLDMQGNILHTNSTVKTRLDYSAEELLNTSVLMVHPEARREEAGRIVGEMLAGTASFCPVPVITKSGEPIPVETRVKLGFWDGQPVIFGVSKDISKIQLSEQKFSSAFQSNSAMMAISSFDDGKYIDVNNEFVETIGYSRAELIGRTNTELGLFVDPELRKKILNDIESHIPVRKLETQIRMKDGSVKTGLLSADSIFIGDERCLLTVTIDISERKKAEEEILKARMEAERANLAKSEFLSRMSHELRTPMNSILGFGQLLQMGELTPGQHKGVNHIIHSGKHLLDLINEVLDISRIESGRLSLSIEPVQLIGIITEMMDSVHPLASERQVAVHLESSPDNYLFVKSDRQRIKQVLLNLISNAIKYNHEGGSVFIKTRLKENTEDGILCHRISISDSGVGISADDLPKLFKPFERIGAEKTAIEGSGLGLAVVKKLVDAMGGQVGVESVHGAGSTFWIDLPSVESQVETLEKSGILKSGKIEQSGKTGTILYIEDNLSNIELVDQILTGQRPNIRLITTTHGKRAVSMAVEHKPDLILLDLNLPDIHGAKVFDSLQAEVQTREIPVVVISADAMPHQLQKLLHAGVKNYLTKPLDISSFLNVVDEHIER